jgi:hypothetical protein
VTLGRALIWICALSCVACAADKESAAERLQGRWLLPSPSNDACGLFLSLGEDGVYELQQTCLLESGAIGIQAEVGTYSVSDGDSVLTFEPTHETCPSADTSVADIKYDFISGGRLRLIFPAGAAVFVPNDDPGKGADQVGAVLKFGCWNGDTFTPHELFKI